MTISEIIATDIEIRWSDLDAYGHVNNVAFFSYLETARLSLLMETGVDFLRGSLQFLVARAECDYRKPILLSDRVAVSMSVARIGNSSFDIDYTVHNGDGVTYAEAKTVMVCYDTKLDRAMPVPADIKRRCQPGRS